MDSRARQQGGRRRGQHPATTQAKHREPKKTPPNSNSDISASKKSMEGMPTPRLLENEKAKSQKADSEKFLSSQGLWRAKYAELE